LCFLFFFKLLIFKKKKKKKDKKKVFPNKANPAVVTNSFISILFLFVIHQIFI
jgi:hypothetical protein